MKKFLLLVIPVVVFLPSLVLADAVVSRNGDRVSVSSFENEGRARYPEWTTLKDASIRVHVTEDKLKGRRLFVAFNGSLPCRGPSEYRGGVENCHYRILIGSEVVVETQHEIGLNQEERVCLCDIQIDGYRGFTAATTSPGSAPFPGAGVYDILMQVRTDPHVRIEDDLWDLTRDLDPDP